MKIHRIGFTEGTLLFIYWLKNLSNIKLSESEINHLNVSESSLINWLHSTSGFYDKTISGSYFDFKYQDYNFNTLNKYLDIIYKSMCNCDVLNICLHNFDDYINIHKDAFINSLQRKSNSNIGKNAVYDFISNKKVLIVSSFANLVKQQHESGNLKKIFNDYPDITSMIYYTSPYTFFNNGPDNNILETCNNIFNDIEKLKDDFDVAVICFGAYSNLLAYHINTKLNKDTLTIGDMFQECFGIINGRHRNHIIKNNITLENKELYIYDIPDEYKPHDYKKIENGCYW